MTILVAYTHTPEGAAALAHGQQMAQLTGQRLALFPLFTPTSEDPWPATGLELGEEAEFLQPDANSTRPAEELVDRSNQIGATMIVIGVRTRSRVGKMLMGSHAQSIILGASVPVLSVKAGEDEH